jgi:Gluconate 2-dehydrogenase subunit 3
LDKILSVTPKKVVLLFCELPSINFMISHVFFRIKIIFFVKEIIQPSIMKMQRRSAIRNIALSIGSAITLPTWANAWNSQSIITPQFIISTYQETILAEIVETIIPKTDTPGAKDLNIHQFTTKMVADCYDKKAQEVFSKGIDLVDALAKKDYSKTFAECDTKQRLDILNKMSNSENNDEKGFMRLVKNLTIQGYLSSEYVMINLRNFEFAPARYHGCVPVKK